MTQEILNDRAILEIRGADARSFLQGLITNDLSRLAPVSPLYAALLTPQGKVVSDFLIYEYGPSVLLDCGQTGRMELERRLSRYKLRAKVEILHRAEWSLAACESACPDENSWRDPRHPALGWRMLWQDAPDAPHASPHAYLDRRLTLGIPEGTDFGFERMFALDADLEELNGVSFEKGCYIGQELTARMKHRATSRKRLVPIITAGKQLPDAGTQISAAGQDIGTVTSVYENRGFALVRLDRLNEAAAEWLKAANVPVAVVRPSWLFP